jgi:metal-sulfur cluster biosynthetic enzyme
MRNPSEPTIEVAGDVDEVEGRSTAEAVVAALASVRDPELDEPLVELGFVDKIVVAREEITVCLRLPTFFCAANFTWVMAEDAREAARGAAPEHDVVVQVADHFAGEELSTGVSDGQAFSATFARLANGDLDDLRTSFRRKAHTSRQWAVASQLRRSGWTPERLASARLRDAPEGPALERLRALRSELGFDTGPDGPLLIGPDGRGLSPKAVEVALDLGRLTAVSMSTNAELCRGLLHVRYAMQEVHA